MKTTRRRRSSSAKGPAATVSLAILLLVVPVAGQEPGSAEGEDTLQAEADTVAADTLVSPLQRSRAALAQIQSAMDSIVALDMRTRGAPEEQRRLANVRAWEYVHQMQELQEDLLDLLPLVMTAGLPPDTVSALTDGVEAVFSREADLYDDALDEMTARVDSLRDLRTTAPPEELAALEVRIQAEKASLDTLVSSKVEMLATADSLGLDMTERWESLDRFLKDWAEGQVGRLQISQVERDRLQQQLKEARKTGAPDSEVAAIRTRLAAVDQRVQGITSSLSNVANLLRQRGYETANYRQIVIRATGEVTADILDPEVLLGLLRDLADGIWTWLKDNGPTLLVRFFIVVAVIILFRVAFRLTWWFLKAIGLVKAQLMADLIGRLVRPTGTVVGLAVGLWLIGVNPTTVLAGLGVAGVIVGLALQDSMSNLAAGMFILATRPFDVEDVVDAGGVMGTVEAMGLANTTIMTFDRRRLFVPNRKIWSEVIENRSSEKIRRAEITVKISYREDLDRALKLVRQLLEDHEMVVEDPEPQIFVSDLADSWIEVTVRPWAKNEDWWPLTMQLRRLVRLRFEETGIEVPYPRTELVASRPAERDARAKSSVAKSDDAGAKPDAAKPTAEPTAKSETASDFGDAASQKPAFDMEPGDDGGPGDGEDDY